MIVLARATKRGCQPECLTLPAQPESMRQPAHKSMCRMSIADIPDVRYQYLTIIDGRWVGTQRPLVSARMERSCDDISSRDEGEMCRGG